MLKSQILNIKKFKNKKYNNKNKGNKTYKYKENARRHRYSCRNVLASKASSSTGILVDRRRRRRCSSRSGEG